MSIELPEDKNDNVESLMVVLKAIQADQLLNQLGVKRKHPPRYWKVAHKIVAAHLCTGVRIGRILMDLADAGVDTKPMTRLTDCITAILAAGASNRN